MRRLVRYTEQLRLAGSFLDQQSHAIARLSLILCDNVTELLAHERCQYHLLASDAPWISAPKLSNADRRKARGQKFNPKLNLLVRLGDLRADERDFATRAHVLRNECYHTAALHEQIAWRVAWEYHELACTLFDRWRQSGMRMAGSVHQSDETREVLESAGFTGRFPPDFTKAIETLTTLLRGTKPPATEPLALILSTAATRRFTELIEAIQFLADDGLRTGSMEDAIREAYFRAHLDGDALKDGIDTQTPEGFAEYHKRWDVAHAKYVAPIRFLRVEGWLERAQALSSERVATMAMVKYMDLKRESSEAVTIIDEMATRLDTAIQHEIDAARGK